MDSIIIFGAKYLIFAVPLLWIAVWLQASRRYKEELIWTSVVAVILAAIADKILSKLYYDPRPFASHHLHPLVAHTADNGFPSEHTLFGITLAVVIFFYRPKVGILTFIIALLVGIARVAAHVHSPIDIIGGALIGILAASAGYWAVTRWRRPKKTGKAEV
jgi:undecaprenyl-diphosphatase